LQLRSLPANSDLIISNWVVSVIKKDRINIILPCQIVLLLVLSLLARTVSSKYLLQLWQEKYGQNNKAIDVGKRKFLIIKNNLLQMSFVDILSFWRQKNDRSYLIFIVFLLTILGVTTKKMSQMEQLTPEFDLAVKLIIYISIMMIAIVLSIRLLFPIAAREKKMMWLNFSLPMYRNKFIDQKLLTTIIMSFIFCVVCLYFSLNINANLLGKIWFQIALTVNVTTIFLIQTLCGFIQPNFIESENEEAVSTNTSGFISLILSFFVSWPLIMFLYLLYRYSYLSAWVFAWLAMTTGILVCLHLIAQKEIKRYNL